MFTEHSLGTVLGAENTVLAKQTGSPPWKLALPFLPISEPHLHTWHPQMPNKCLGKRLTQRARHYHTELLGVPGAAQLVARLELWTSGKE